MADSSCGEEEEYEYEEVEIEEEVEVEEEVEEEEEEEIEEEEEEIEEEEEEEDEEIVEEEEETIPEVEKIAEEEEEEEYEEVEEEVEEEEEEEEEEYEEVEEEVEEEVDVSDDDEKITPAVVTEEDTASAIDVKMAMEAVAEAKAKAIEEEEKAAAIDKEMAMEAVAEAKAKAKEEETIDESAVGLSDLRAPVADHSRNDVRLDKESKRNDLCSRSRLRNTANSEVVTPLDDSQQKRKGKDVLSRNDGRVEFPERPSSVANPRKLGDDTVESEQGPIEISPLLATVKNQQSHVIPLTPAVASEEHVSTADSIHDKHCKIETNDINDKRGAVETSPLALTMKNQQSHDIHEKTPAVTPMEHVSTPDGTHDKLCKSETTDIDEMRFPSQREDLHLPPSEKLDQKASRYYTPQLRLRSSSPGGETDISSKRPALICEFFAKGWCIKGSSCRFLHKRDQVDDNRGQVEGNKLSTKVENCPSKDSGDASGASVSRAHNQPKYLRTDSDDLLPISTAGMSTEKDHREPVRENDDFCLPERDGLYRRLSSSSQRSPSSKDGSKLASGRNEAAVDMRNGNRSYDGLDHRGSSVSFGRSALLDNVAPDHGFLQRGIGVDSDAQLNSLHPYALVEESIALRRQYTMELHSSPICEFSARSRNSFRNSSLSDNSALKDMLISYKKRRFTPYNWEPSVPFRPSSYINSLAASSSEVPYDPLRDSIEQPYIGHDPFRGSYQRAENISRRNSLESPKRLHGDSNNKDYCSRDKDAHVVEAESAAISATNAVNNIMSDENNPVVAASVKDVLKTSKSISDGSSNKLKIGGPKQNGDIGRQMNNGLDEDTTRVIKFFRAALVEFVKELLKPVWHEGRLSKDVYKVIVQKAEDKILSTLPSNEVPDTSEAIKLYLSSSRPNILKLIQAYVDKYGKF